MYFLKAMCVRESDKSVSVENGIRVGSGIIARESFWGETNIVLSRDADTSKFCKLEDDEGLYGLLDCINYYTIEELQNGYKKLNLYSLMVDETVSGYIIFLKQEGDIKTNGTIIFSRDSHEIVVQLCEQQYLEFSNKRMEVINSKLMLII